MYSKVSNPIKEKIRVLFIFGAVILNVPSEALELPLFVPLMVILTPAKEFPSSSLIVPLMPTCAYVYEPVSYTHLTLPTIRLV